MTNSQKQDAIAEATDSLSLGEAIDIVRNLKKYGPAVVAKIDAMIEPALKVRNTIAKLFGEEIVEIEEVD